jgi:hypothetical protein
VNKVFELENKIDISSFIYKNYKIWPVIRLFILLSRPKTNKGIKFSFFKRILFFVLGMKEYLKWKLFKRHKSKNLFLTSSHYKVTENNILYDRILDPFISWLDDKNESFQVIEYTQGLKYNSNINYRDHIVKLQAEIYFLSFFWKLEYKILGFKNRPIGNFDKLNKEMKKLEIDYQIDANFFWRFFLLEKQSLFFESFLKETNATNIGIVCYYDFKSLALTWAANRLKLKSIDFQHGVQGTQHFAYSNWPQKFIKDSVFIPTNFWVWDKFSFDTIKKWKESGVILGCNKWMLDRATSSTSEIILFTAQPLENPLPNHLLEIIKKCPERKWYLRLHPHQIIEIDNFRSILNDYGILDYVNISDATYLPLTDLLAKTKVHITKSSSVAIEASYYEIPTIFIDYMGESYFKDQIPKHLQFHVYTKNNLEQAINVIDTNSEKFSYKLRKDDLDRFKNFATFYLSTS